MAPRTDPILVAKVEPPMTLSIPPIRNWEEESTKTSKKFMVTKCLNTTIMPFRALLGLQWALACVDCETTPKPKESIPGKATRMTLSERTCKTREPRNGDNQEDIRVQHTPIATIAQVHARTMPIFTSKLVGWTNRILTILRGFKWALTIIIHLIISRNSTHINKYHWKVIVEFLQQLEDTHNSQGSSIRWKLYIKVLRKEDLLILALTPAPTATRPTMNKRVSLQTNPA